MLSTTRPLLNQISGTWVPGALTTNPSANDILATTGQLAAGEYLFAYIMHATVATTVVIAHRNAADSADVGSKEIPLQASSIVELTFPVKIKVVKNERVVVRQKANLTGDVQASIFYARTAG